MPCLPFESPAILSRHETASALRQECRNSRSRNSLADALPHPDVAIGALSESDRERILLRYIESLSFSEAPVIPTVWTCSGGWSGGS